MMSADDRALEELLYGSDLGDLGDRADIAELSGGQTGTKESAAADNVSMFTSSTAVKVQFTQCQNAPKYKPVSVLLRYV